MRKSAKYDAPYPKSSTDKARRYQGVKYPNGGFTGKASKSKPQKTTGGNYYRLHLKHTPVAGANGKEKLT